MIAALALAVACNDGTAPKNDTTTTIDTIPKVAAIEYQTDAALAFLRHGGLIRDVVRAYDSAGAELSSDVLDLALPGGWTRSGDTLKAPSFETYGRLTAHAKARNALRASLAGDVNTDSLGLTAALDVRLYVWASTWTCSGGGNVVWTDGTVIDSIQYSATVDSSGYANADSSFITNYGGVATMYWRGTAHAYLHDGRTPNFPAGDPIQVNRQAPDTLAFDPSFIGRADALVAIRQPNSTTYVGGSWCRSDWANRGTVTLVGTLR